MSIQMNHPDIPNNDPITVPLDSLETYIGLGWVRTPTAPGVIDINAPGASARNVQHEDPEGPDYVDPTLFPEANLGASGEKNKKK